MSVEGLFEMSRVGDAVGERFDFEEDLVLPLGWVLGEGLFVFSEEPWMSRVGDAVGERLDLELFLGLELGWAL